MPNPLPTVTLDDVLARSDVWRGNRLASAPTPALASGYAALDAQLPGGGWARGSLAEILGEAYGVGECTLLAPALRHLHQQGASTLLVAPPHAPCAAAWRAATGDLAPLIVVTAHAVRDALWATEQALASGALGAVLCWAPQINAAQVRRLEVAVAGSDTLAFLFRPAGARHAASPCALRLALGAAAHGRLAVDVLKRRGPPCAQTLYLDVERPWPWSEDHETLLDRRPPAAVAARIARRAVAA